MKKNFLAVCTLLFLPLAAHAAGGADPSQGVRAKSIAAQPQRLADGLSPVLAAQLVARWEPSLRQSRGWDDGAIEMFRAELLGMPSDTLQKAMETRNWDTLQSILLAHQGEAAATRLSQLAAAWRSGELLDDTNVEDAQLKRGMTKALGDANKDLIFVPIQPCTTWDTRFATLSPHNGQIAAGSNKPGFVYHSSAGAFNWGPYGGNPSCTETGVVAAYGVIPYAVAYTLYTANASAQGWVTAYRDGDADPSSATISLYYTPGPTQSTTVITRVGRANAQTYDIRVASQFGNVDVAVSVIGYFIQSAATALQCQEVYVANTVIAAGATACQFTNPVCPTGYSPVAGVSKWISGNAAPLAQSQADPATSLYASACWNNTTAASATMQAGVRCCRVPGR